MRAFARVMTVALLASVLPVGAARADAPSAPQDFDAVGALRSVELSWDAPASDGGHAIERYLVLRYDDATETWGVAANLTAEARSFTDEQVVSCEITLYEIFAVNADGGGASAFADGLAHESAPCPPRFPTASFDGSVVEVSWIPPRVTNSTSTLLSYHVERAANPGEAFVRIGTVDAETLAFTDDAPHFGNLSSYRVIAEDNVAESPPSENATMDLRPPSEPRDLRANKVLLVGIVLMWEAPTSEGGAPLDAYRVYRKVNGGADSLLATTDEDDLEHTDTTCPIASTCTYRVSAVSALGEGPRSNGVAVVG